MPPVSSDIPQRRAFFFGAGFFLAAGFLTAAGFAFFVLTEGFDSTTGAGFGDSAAGFVSEALGFESSEEDELDSSLSGPARFRLFSLSDLKSVSYHPPPFKRKFGAEISFFIVLLPQEGHFFSGSSEIFCMTSE
jgi:hypothetical protein